MNLAFKTVANAIELAIIASLTALTCKRCAASLRIGDSIKMAEVLEGQLVPVVHELYLLVYDCTFGRVSLGFHTDT